MIDVAVGLLVGVGLGTVFFGGLAWTLQRLPRSRHPALVLLASFAVRGVLTLGALAVLAQTSWLTLAGALAAFVAVRVVIVRIAASRVDPFRERRP